MALYGPRPAPLPHPLPEPPLLQEPPWAGPWPGSLRRFEFVAACEALLADSPGCASVGDLHDLFDLLDPGCTGSVSLQRFSELLRAHRSSASEAAAPQWANLGIFGAPGSATGGSLATPLAGLRAWMLQHNWLFQDLIQAFDGPLERFAWPEFGDRLLEKIHGPWVTRLGAKEIFDQLKVRGVAPAGTTAAGGREMAIFEVRVCDLVEALLDSKPFADEMARRCIRVIFREGHNRQIDVDRECRFVDRNRTGVLDRVQLRKVVDGICRPDAFSDADVACLFGRFAVAGARFRYDGFLQALEDERFAYSEHLLSRALPLLISQAAEFERNARLKDREVGVLSEEQLQQVLLQLDLGLVEQTGLTEVGDFVELLLKATGMEKEKGPFRYSRVVSNGKWIGPGVDEAIAVVCKDAPPRKYGDPDDQLPAAPKSYLVSILFYKTSETCRKMGLSAQQAFDRLDRGGKGFLDPQDIRQAVLEVLGEDQTVAQLGISQYLKLRLADFEKRLDFDVRLLESHLEEVFDGSGGVLPESDLVARMSKLGLRNVVVTNWLSLLYPAGVPPDGVERSVCETFFATHSGDPPADPPPEAPDSLLRAARHQLCQSDVNFRQRLLAAITDAGDDSMWPQRGLVNAVLSGSLGDDAQVNQVLAAVGKTSAYYTRTLPGERLRAETLLAVAEAYEDHILEVRLESVSGLGAMHRKKVSRHQPLEVCLRYWCRGTEYVAETTPLDAGSASSPSNASLALKFVAVHNFGLGKNDALHILFEGAKDALIVQAWGGAFREPRQLLATTGLPAAELHAFLRDAAAQLRTPEVLLGSQKDWTLPFKDLPGAGGVAIRVTYNKRAARSAAKPPLPWASTFTGSLVLCPLGAPDIAGSMEPADHMTAVSGPGAVTLKLKLQGFLVHVSPLKDLLARCLEGCAMPGPVHGAGTGLFLRFCLFPANPGLQAAGCGWVQSSVSRLPEHLFIDGADADSLLVDADFGWGSALIEPGEVVAGLRDGKASLQLWLRTAPCTPGAPSSWASGASSGTPLAADVQLAEEELSLKELLRASSPDEPTKLRLRTLRSISIDPTVAFKAEKKGDVVAELVFSLGMELPKGPRVVSWFVDADNTYDNEVDYAVVLHEVWLSRDAVAGSRSMLPPEYVTDYGSEYVYEQGRWRNGFWGPDRTGRDSAPPWYFFAEFGQGGPDGFGKGKPYYRSAPVEGKPEGSSWIRMELDENALVNLFNRPALGASETKDIEIRTGMHHGLRVRILQMGRSGGSKLVAEASFQLPLGEAKEGGPGKFFGVHLWRPLFHTAPESPTMVTVGRARITVRTTYPANAEDTPATYATPLLEQLPSPMPSGIFLPMYSTWDAPAGKWPLEAVIRDFTKSMAPELWENLLTAETRSNHPRAVLEDDFEGALSSSPLADGLNFLRIALAPLFEGEGSAIPWIPLMYWLALRGLAMLVLPKMGRLLQHLQQLDRGRDLLTGTVPLKAFQEALRRELADVPHVPPALMTLLSRRPQWSLGAVQFLGHEQFDYISFLWDLNDSGIGVQVSLRDDVPSDDQAQARGPGAVADDWRSDAPASVYDCPGDDVLPYGEDRRVYTGHGGRGCVTIGIMSALHIHDEQGQELSTFVTYRWARPGDNEPTGDFGRTPVVHRNSSPQWNYKASMVLPVLHKAGRRIPYPEAFNDLKLLLHIYHLDERRGLQQLIGIARLPLAPLHSGFPEIDGYYYIRGPDEPDEDATPPPSGPRRQIRASVTPQWSSISGPTGPPGMGRTRAFGTRSSYSSISMAAPVPLLRPFVDVPYSTGAFAPSALSPGFLASARDPLLLPEEEVGLSAASRLGIGFMPGSRVPVLLPEADGGLSAASRLGLGLRPGVRSPALVPEVEAAAQIGAGRRSLELDGRLPSVFASANDWDRNLREGIYSVKNLFGDGDVRAGVHDDVSTTELRFASRLSDTEMRLRSLEGTEEQQLQQLWELNRENLATLDQQQQRMLPPIAILPNVEPAMPPVLSSMPFSKYQPPPPAAAPAAPPPAPAPASAAAPAPAPAPVAARLPEGSEPSGAGQHQLLAPTAALAPPPPSAPAGASGDQAVVQSHDDAVVAQLMARPGDEPPAPGSGFFTFADEPPEGWWPQGASGSYPEMGGSLLPLLPEFASLPEPQTLGWPQAAAQEPLDSPLSRAQAAVGTPAVEEPRLSQDLAARQLFTEGSETSPSMGGVGLREELFPAIGQYVGLGQERPSASDLPAPSQTGPALGSSFGWAGSASGAGLDDLRSSREGILQSVGQDILASTSL